MLNKCWFFPSLKNMPFLSIFIVITLVPDLLASSPHLLLYFHNSFSFLSLLLYLWPLIHTVYSIDPSGNNTAFLWPLIIQSQPTYAISVFTISNSIFHTFSISDHTRYPNFVCSLLPAILTLLPDTFFTDQSFLKFPHLECSSLSLSNYSVLISQLPPSSTTPLVSPLYSY